MTAKFDYINDKQEENKIMGIGIAKAEVKKEAKTAPLTDDTIFSYKNTQTNKRMFFVWSQLKHMVTASEYTEIVKNPDEEIVNHYNKTNGSGGYIIKRA